MPESLMELCFVDCSNVDGEEVGEVDMIVVGVVMSNTLSLRTENQVLKGKW